MCRNRTFKREQTMPIPSRPDKKHSYVVSYFTNSVHNYEDLYATELNYCYVPIHVCLHVLLLLILLSREHERVYAVSEVSFKSPRQTTASHTVHNLNNVINTGTFRRAWTIKSRPEGTTVVLWPSAGGGASNFITLI